MSSCFCDNSIMIDDPFGEVDYLAADVSDHDVNQTLNVRNQNGSTMEMGRESNINGQIASGGYPETISYPMNGDLSGNSQNFDSAVAVADTVTVNGDYAVVCMMQVEDGASPLRVPRPIPLPVTPPRHIRRRSSYLMGNVIRKVGRHDAKRAYKNRQKVYLLNKRDVVEGALTNWWRSVATEFGAWFTNESLAEIAETFELRCNQRIERYLTQVGLRPNTNDYAYVKSHAIQHGKSLFQEWKQAVYIIPPSHSVAFDSLVANVIIANDATTERVTVKSTKVAHNNTQSGGAWIPAQTGICRDVSLADGRAAPKVLVLVKLAKATHSCQRQKDLSHSKLETRLYLYSTALFLQSRLEKILCL